MHKKLILFVAMAMLLAGVAPSCKISYSFTGANISPAVKTYSVYYFPNRAPLINPTLSQTFTEALREKLQRQTSLNELAENGDLIFEGQITGYEVRPMSIQKDDLAALNRLTITINVKYTNNIDPDQSLEQSFSAFEDFDSTSSLSDVEDGLVPEILNKITEDIFNATLANW
ncbi:MAG: LptE family protein [Mariniphaga sp.]|nr:LptE family protein [Mariniphaga sp.]MDD4225132.1 LptE family protein [Mariniphaga sp.]MDD4424644.1 LptE family protein [Mariniphaga sp.]